MIKIDIISGFLGAGKTTLIAKLLKEKLSDEKVILIENEFGEIGIDSGFLKSTGIEIREMNSGCICCSLVGDFGAALQEVIEKYSPDRVIIEPSGVGKLSDVIKAVQNAEGKMRCDVRINCAVTVVDVTKCKIHLKNFGEFYKDQIKEAGTVILTRTDLPKATKEKVDEAVSLIKAENPEAAIVTTPIVQLSAEKLLKVMEEGCEDLSRQLMDEVEHHHHHEHHNDHEHGGHCCCGHGHDHPHEHEHHHDHEEHHGHDGHCCCGHDHHHHHDHDADEVFTSWGRETANKYSVDEIRNIVEKLSGSEYGVILRAKGIVALDDGCWEYFDMVPGEAEVRPGEPEFTGRLCVIGTDLKEEKIAELFRV